MDDLTGKLDSSGPPDGQLTAAEWNQLAQEIVNFLTFSAITSSGADLNQIAKTACHLAATSDFYNAGGTANAITLAILGRPGAASYSTGLRVRWLPGASNTGAATINVNSLGVKDLKRPDGTVLQANDVLTGRVAEAYYDVAGHFRLTPGSIPLATAALPSGYITGLTFTPPAADLDHDVTFAPGQCRDTTNAGNLVLAAALTKRFDGASFGLGTGQTGFPIGQISRAANTWYRVFMVGHTDGRVDFGFDTLATADNLLADCVSADVAGWTRYRQLGWVLTTVGSVDALVPGVFQWIKRDVNAHGPGSLVTTRTARSLSAHCPPNAVAEVQVLIEPPSGASSERRNLLLTDKNQADYAPNGTNYTLTTKSAAGPGNNAWTPIGTALVEVDGSSEIYERWDAASSWERVLQVHRFRFAR
jgi:hypothetical protein